MKVLVVGGSGYLGQFLVHSLATFKDGQHQVVFTYNSSNMQSAPKNAVSCKVNLVSGEGLSEAFEQYGPFHAVINCAAISQPGHCQRDSTLAWNVNVPSALLSSLQQQQSSCGTTACLIHLSTDQVYDGSKAWWCEEEVCTPVNVYGESKLQGERAIQGAWKHHVILRSSIIFGPEPPEPVDRALFLSFLDKSLGDTQNACPPYFEDEWRCPVYVQDIVTLCRRILDLEETKELAPLVGVYNMGGPERLSRFDMAHLVAKVRKYDETRIVGVPASSISRSVCSPQDISMRSDRLESAFGVKLLGFEAALHKIFST